MRNLATYIAILSHMDLVLLRLIRKPNLSLKRMVTVGDFLFILRCTHDSASRISLTEARLTAGCMEPRRDWLAAQPIGHNKRRADTCLWVDMHCPAC